MKSYEDIAKSVLKKSEERMAEKKRGGIIFGKKAAIASGLCAACLCGIGFWKLDSIRNSMDKQKIPQIVEMQPTTTAAVTSAAPSTTAVTAVITDGSQTTQITVTTASSQTGITSTASVQTANTSASTTTASVQTQATQQTHASQTTTAKSTTTRTHTTTRKQTTTAKTTTTQRYTVTTANQTTIITPVPFTTSPPVYATTTKPYIVPGTTSSPAQRETTAHYTHTTPSVETPAASETVPSNYIGSVTKTTVNQNFKRIYVSGISDSVYSLTSESFDITDEFYRDIYIQSADSFNSYGNYFTYASIKGYYYNSEYIALLYDGCNELFYYKRED